MSRVNTRQELYPTNDDQVLNTIVKYCKSHGKTYQDGPTSNSNGNDSRIDKVLEKLDALMDGRQPSVSVRDQDLKIVDTNLEELGRLEGHIIPEIMKMQRGILTELQENKQTKAGLQWRLHALEARLKSKDNIIRELSDKVKSLSDGRDLAIMKMRKQVLDLQHELGKTGNDKTSFVDGDHIEDCIKTLDELMDLASVPAAEMTDARLERIRERSKELKKELKSLYPTLVSP